MAPTKFNYLFAVASLLLISAAQSPFTEAREYIGVNQWCHTAFHRRLCTRMVNGAVSQHEASMNVLQSTLDYANRLKSMLPMVQSAVADLDPEKQHTVMTTCADEFNGNIDDLEKVIAAMQASDQGAVLSRLSAALRTSICDAALTESRVTSPIRGYAKLWHKEVDNCLAVITQT